MKPDAVRCLTGIEVNGDSVYNLVLQVTEILALGRDSPGAVWGVPGRQEEARILVSLHLECDFIHLYLG